MTMTRTIRATQPGPVHLRSSLPSQDLTVDAVPCDHGEITLSTADDDGPSADVVNAATLTVNGNELRVHLPRGAGGTTIVSGNGSPILVTAQIPPGSTVTAESTSGDIEIRGSVASADLDSTSGSILVGNVIHVDAQTVSGGICVDNLRLRGRLKSVSGSIVVHGPQGASCSARTISGDVSSTGGIELDASTVSGRVRNR